MVPPPDEPTTDVATAAVGPLQALELAAVARRHYVEGRSRVEISEELGISRFRVARMLEEALAAGIVRIEVSTSSHVDLELSEAVAARYELQRAVVATTSDLDRDKGRAAVASLAASLLAEVLQHDDVVGIGGGLTLHDVVAQLPSLPGCSAVQLLGGVPGVGLWANSVDIVRQFAEKTGGPIRTYLLPFLVEDATVAEKLQHDAQYAEAKSLFPLVTVALTAVGSWDPPRSGLHDLLEETQRRELRNRGVVADVLGALVDRDGRVVETELAARSTGITVDEIRPIPSVIAVASGTSRAAAVAATLRSGLVTTLVTDSATARWLLQDADDSRGEGHRRR